MSVQPFQEKEPGRVRLILREIWKMLRTHFGFKILALILAVILWGGLISTEPNLTRNKEMTGTAVSVIGRDNLQRSGYAVIDGLDDLAGGVTIRAEVPQRQYKAATGDLYRPTVDLSKVDTSALGGGTTLPATIDLPITVSMNTAYGEVLEIRPKTVSVTVDRYSSNRSVPVRRSMSDIRTVGEPPEGLTVTDARSDMARLSVSGPASVVETIRYAVPVVSLSAVERKTGAQEMAAPFLLIGENGQEVSADQLSVTYNAVPVSNLIVTLTVEEKRQETAPEE